MDSAGERFKAIRAALADRNNILTVKDLCELAGVSRSGYYNWVRSEKNRELREAKDRAAFEQILEAYRFRGYAKGVRGIHMRLLHMGIRMNVKKIRRLMRKYKLTCPIRKPNPYRRLQRSIRMGSAADVARQFFCETRTEFLRKNSPFLRTKSETRSLASKATKTYRLLMQSSGEFNTPGGAVNPLLPLLFLPLLHAILGALFLGRQILGNRDDIHFRELLDVTLSVFHENGVDRDHILLNFHLFCPPSSFATLFSRAAFCSARLAISS